MRAQRRSAFRTATVATGALAVLLLPAGAAFADSTAPTNSRASILLPDEGLAGIAEKAEQLPKAGLIGGAGALGAAGVALAVRRRNGQDTPRTAHAAGTAQRASR
ncbi:hypothetical protein GCM10010211_60560 [Streptomyces albospinus]|uniref:Gram-positive cocci surface proteins LPxTG domain-containing protein n=1 Tax=Streptomyces albospinus TaxID=285515 RepID=A0ABQ2VGU0_9ACTN|nr:hypothetical protein [Streptomyces albospinus]GGU86397.1 hypothetical protein GCM10010211_60560 [Streptomyces albospinus]